MNKLFSAFLIAIGAVLCVPNGPAFTQDMTDYCAIPPFISAKGPPLVMLVISKEHKLFMEAYTDYNDISSPKDGIIDTTYDDGITYYGYFDSYKDYNYDESKFVPVGATVTGTHKRSTGQWSGNFLNWATMSRIDTIRKVLYGGYRCVDLENNTVLERAAIPTDAHSWVKVYPKDATHNPVDFTPYDETITLGNTTLTSGGLPLLRVATGNESASTVGWPRWAANERWQCVGRTDHTDDVDFKIPATIAKDYTVRVQVAVDGKLGTEKVKQYPPNNYYKPIGLLQEYGEDDTIYFGLITGSYRKNKSGGVLRRNITSFSSEVNSNTGIFTGVSGIVKNLNAIKIVNYQYTDGSYGSTCTWGLYSFTDDQCRSWGNPIGEMYYESLRYYAGKGYTSDYVADDSSYGLTTEAWTNPYSVYPRCSQPNILVITDENPSFDRDNYPGISDIGITSVTDLTNAIEQGNLSGDYFIGNNGTTNDNQCTAKTISGLGAVYGLCQEEPRRAGSYYSAGLAHYAKTHDINSVQGDQKSITYSVVLNTKLPEILIPVGGTTVKLIPACRTYSTDTPHRVINGSLVDFRVVSQDAASGKFYVNWENSEQGGDFDQDCDGYLSYQVSGNQITVTAQIVSHSAGRRFDFGYILSGTTSDGLQLPINSCNGCNYQVDAPTTPLNYQFFSDADADATNPMLEAYRPLAPSYCGDCSKYKAAWQFLCHADTYTAGTTAAKLLKDPFWYSAKWGGFNDIDGDTIPDDSPSEWDRDANGDPDTYFYVQNPLQLEEQLNKAIGEILKRVSSGTAVSVLSTSAAGEGSLFQAYFNPSVYTLVDGKIQEITWVGYLNSLWVDQYGNLREDNGDKRLVLTEDPIIVFDLDTNGDTIVRKYSDTNGDGVADASLGAYSLADLQPIWEAGKNLALRTSTRRIFTFIDEDNDGVKDSTEWGDDKFDTGDAGDLRPYLGAASDLEAENIISFIRQGTYSGCQRERRVDGSHYWRLGDIVNSTPTVVGMPMDQYHLIYGDTTYLDFVRDKKSRKTMIYVGGNDGMLHAFSAGTYHEGNDGGTPAIETGWYDDDEYVGKELWAYIPYNLLSSLKWLADPAYCHVYYVDLKAKVVDARIFSDSGEHGDHPRGWGTVLIGAMRLGGKGITRTDTFYGTTSEERTFRSAYFAIDITNPDTPDLLWEYTDDDLVSTDDRFTTSYPAVARVGEKDVAGNWYVIFGSGPTTYDGAGAATGHVYVLNLVDGQEQRKFDISLGNPSFMASPITVDLGLDYGVDVAYIGASYYDSTDLRWEGKIYRIDIRNLTPVDWTGPSTVISFNQPITVAPVAALDPANRLWLFWGTGRFFSIPDKTSTSVQRLYGVWDPGAWDSSGTEIYTTQLNPVKDISVYQQGFMNTSGLTFQNYLAAKRAEYSSTTDPKYGWYLTMTSPIGIDGERVINTPTLLGDIVLFPSFKPEGDICQYGGNSYLYALYYETGTAYEESVIGTTSEDTLTIGTNTYEKILNRTLLGSGMPTSVVIHAGREEGVTGMVQLGTGVVKEIDINPATSPQSKVIFWREKTE